MSEFPGRSDYCGTIDDHLECDGSECTCPCHDVAYRRWLEAKDER